MHAFFPQVKECGSVLVWFLYFYFFNILLYCLLGQLHCIYYNIKSKK